MLDIGIAFGVAFLTFAMGFMGVIVTLHPPVSSTEKWAWKIAFGVSAFLACGLVVWQTQRNVQEQNGLNASVTSLSGQLNKSETERQKNDAYFRAKLEDYKSLQALAPSLLRLGEATEGFTQKQYEEQRLSDVQLLDFTRSVVKRIRAIGSSCDARKQSIDSKIEMAPPNMTSDQWARWIGPLDAQEEAVRTDCESQYRAQVLNDAFYARQQLSTRLGRNNVEAVQKEISGQLYASVFMGDDAINGNFFGPHTIDASANYLEALADEFAVRKGLKRRP